MAIKYHHIAISPDENYAHPGLTMLNSLIKNNKNKRFYIHVFDGGIGKKSKLKYLIFFARKKLKFKFYKVDYSKIINAPVHGHVTLSAYSRIFIASLVDPIIQRITYLDCDMTINGDLDGLLNANLENNFLGAVEERVSREVIEKLNHFNNPYFNSGVLVYNLKIWRENNSEQKMIDFIVQYPDKITYWDQDVLNYCLKGKWKRLDQKYNVTHFFFYPNEYPPSYFGLNDDEYQEIHDNTVIIHYTSHQKPWIEGCKHPKKDLYFKYELTFSKLLFGRI